MSNSINVDYYKKHTTCAHCNKVEYEKVDISSIKPSLYINITKQSGLWKLSLRNGDTDNKFWDKLDEWLHWGHSIEDVAGGIYKYKGLAGKEGVIDISMPNNRRMKIHSGINKVQLKEYAAKMLRG